MKMNLSTLLLFACFAIIPFTASLATAATTQEYVGGFAHSRPVPLTSDSFDQAINDVANSLWLLKFYAPWCGHCKRLAPVLEDVAPKIKGKMAIGTIDCTKEKELCKQYEIRGFPTLKVARDGEIYNYPGSRKADSMIQFANKMSQYPVKLVDSYKQAVAEVAMQSTVGVAFCVYHPNVKGNNMEEMMQSTRLTQVFAQVARMLQAQADFCLVSPQAETLEGFTSSTIMEGGDGGPFVVKIEEHVPSKPLELKSESVIAPNDIKEFVLAENAALVTDMTPNNYAKLARKGKPLVLGLYDGNKATAHLPPLKQDLANFGVQHPKLASNYYFGYMNGREWFRFLESFNITVQELPQLMALDIPKRTYWHSPDIQTTLGLVTGMEDGSIVPQKAKQAAGQGFAKTLIDLFLQNMPWSILLVFLVIFSIALLFVPSPTDLRPPYNETTTSNANQEQKTTKENDAGETMKESKTENKKDK